MRVVEIQQLPNSGYRRRFQVHYEPSWLERVFGTKPKVKQFVEDGSYFPFMGANGYIDERGNVVTNRAIDKWINQQKFQR